MLTLPGFLKIIFLKHVGQHVSNYAGIISVATNLMLQRPVAQLLFIAVGTCQGTALKYYAQCFE